MTDEVQVLNSVEEKISESMLNFELMNFQNFCDRFNSKWNRTHEKKKNQGKTESKEGQGKKK